jgi:hypothetical protein
MLAAMSMYEQVLLYDLTGAHRGNAILKNIQGGKVKLDSLNVWTDSEQTEIDAQLKRLDDLIPLKANWPRQDDLAVQALLADATWEPAATSPTSVTDEEKSFIVRNEFDDIDETKSVIVNKIVEMPSPTAVAERIRKAMEIVAHERANV